MWNVEYNRNGSRNEQSRAWVVDITSAVLYGDVFSGADVASQGSVRHIAAFSDARAAECPKYAQIGLLEVVSL